MSDKLKDVRGRKPSEDDIVQHEETRDTKEPDLVPDPSVVVATGDEAAPVSSADPKEARKALYEKARKRREETISRESEQHVDVDRIRAMQAEASGGDVDPETEIDTNRRDRFHQEDEGEEERAAARLMDEQGKKQEQEPESTKETSVSAKDALTKYDPDARVAVKILGQEYSVPQQDIDDAGGLEAYQKSRAATLRLQKIATLDRALETAKAKEPARGEQQDADPSTDGLDEADITSLREKIVDAMVDGDDLNAVDKVLKEALTSRRTKTPSPKPQPQPRSQVGESERRIIQEAREELMRQNEEDRLATNEMMRTEYADLMNDKDMLSFTQQRYQMLASDPANVGRTQKELAREAAEHVRYSVRKFLNQPSRESELEAERQRRITRKRKLPQASRADAPAPEPQRDERKIPSRKEHLMRLRQRAGLETPPD